MSQETFSSHFDQSKEREYFALAAYNFLKTANMYAIGSVEHTLLVLLNNSLLICSVINIIWKCFFQLYI